jgi:Ca2+-binding EF-hand superfamily protein
MIYFLLFGLSQGVHLQGKTDQHHHKADAQGKTEKSQEDAQKVHNHCKQLHGLTESQIEVAIQLIDEDKSKTLDSKEFQTFTKVFNLSDSDQLFKEINLNYATAVSLKDILTCQAKAK